MMREILFRGKRKDNGEWIYGNYCGAEYLQSEGIEHLIIEIPKTGCSKQIILETVGQFTGLTDTNGKKIFEGDIVRYTDEESYYPEEQCEFIGKIVFEIGAFGIATNDNIPIDLNCWCGNDNFVSLWELYWNLSVEGEMLDMIEVIGNIHDNPELLKEGVNNDL